MKENTPKSVSFLLLSGGVGARSQHHEPKQFYPLGGHPMIAYAIMAAADTPEISEILVNAPEGFAERTREILKTYAGSKPYSILPCGEDRQKSSLILCEAAQGDIVIIHEAARPVMDVAMLQFLINAKAQNAGYCLPVSFSTCKIDQETGMITEGVPRKEIANIQLPQKFCKETILNAHQVAKTKATVFTEDAIMCIETVGAPVLALDGNSNNLKVTTKADFLVVAKLLERTDK